MHKEHKRICSEYAKSNRKESTKNMFKEWPKCGQNMSKIWIYANKIEFFVTKKELY